MVPKMDWKMLIAPAVGGLIGYLTNYIAIKMLFHPHKAHYVGKWRIPLTPGLIPKEQGNIARSIGEVISRELLNEETLRQVLTSEETAGKVRSALIGLVEENRENESSLRDLIVSVSSEEAAERSVSSAREKLSAVITERLCAVDFGEAISNGVKKKVIADGHSSRFRLGVIDTFYGSIGSMVNKTVAKYADSIVEDLVDDETGKLLDLKLSELIKKYDEKIPGWIEQAVGLYVSAVDANTGRILAGVNIQKIVEDKINGLEIRELEKLILGLAKTELNAIVYLGALLGFIMGWITPLLGV
ncbi:MAG: DUF445 family protein [Clostridia bacterium]|nr:DUF445 family protein [Clostridia bacterium]